MKVRNTASMSPDDFARHMNARHAQVGELADLKAMSPLSAVTAKDRSTWEAYHSRLHEYREYEHVHPE